MEAIIQVTGYHVFPMFVVRSYLHVWWEYMGM